MICHFHLQLALTDILQLLGVTPEGFIGHSTGEVACGYCDGGLTREQAMLLAYYRGQTILEAQFPPGGMAAIGLTWESAKEKLPEGVYAACHNGSESVSISGEQQKVSLLVEELEKEGTFAKVVDSSGIAFHSPWMAKIEDTLMKKFKTVRFSNAK